jgi:hypothetical protein
MQLPKSLDTLVQRKFSSTIAVNAATGFHNDEIDFDPSMKKFHRSARLGSRLGQDSIWVQIRSPDAHPKVFLW